MNMVSERPTFKGCI